MTTVRTTIRPDVELGVDDAELLDLERHGLLVRDDGDRKPAASRAEKGQS